WSGAGEGNRTLVVSLEGFCSAIELHPRQGTPGVEGEGFEPSKAEPADLQSAPFDRSGTPPSKRAILAVAAPRGQTSAAYEVPLEPREEDLYNHGSGARPPERHLRRGRSPP